MGIGFEPFHLSHQASLVRKLPSHYEHQFEHPMLPLLVQTAGYLWPHEVSKDVKVDYEDEEFIKNTFRPITVPRPSKKQKMMDEDAALVGSNDSSLQSNVKSGT